LHHQEPGTNDTEARRQDELVKERREEKSQNHSELAGKLLNKQTNGGSECRSRKEGRVLQWYLVHDHEMAIHMTSQEEVNRTIPFTGIPKAGTELVTRQRKENLSTRGSTLTRQKTPSSTNRYKIVDRHS
jgi:hypothetical protein